MRILCGTNWIGEDEPCFELYEHDVKLDHDKHKNRYRVYRVLRNDRIIEYQEKLGTTKQFKGIEPLVILGGVIDNGKMCIDYNVGELREMVDQYRNHVHFDLKEFTKLDKINIG